VGGRLSPPPKVCKNIRSWQIENISWQNGKITGVGKIKIYLGKHQIIKNQYKILMTIKFAFAIRE